MQLKRKTPPKIHGSNCRCRACSNGRQGMYRFGRPSPAPMILAFFAYAAIVGFVLLSLWGVAR